MKCLNTLIKGKSVVYLKTNSNEHELIVESGATNLLDGCPYVYG